MVNCDISLKIGTRRKVQYGEQRADRGPSVISRIIQPDHKYVYNIVTAGGRTVFVMSSNNTKFEFKESRIWLPLTIIQKNKKNTKK